jgi:endonuclease-3
MEQKEFAWYVHQRLLDVYGYPQWRDRKPPLDELVSTILSQNTNDVNRDRAFKNLRLRFPTWEAVRDADEQDVVDAIRTAGLANQKGPRIQNILREITEQRAGLSLDFLEALPVEEAKDWLMSFKGVGPKTAAIVLLFSLGKPAFPVDTHIHRVSGRLGLRPEKMNAEQAHQHLAELFPANAFYPVHLNLIRLGREICHARRPECPECPFMDECNYYIARSRNSAGGSELTENKTATEGKLDG